MKARVLTSAVAMMALSGCVTGPERSASPTPETALVQADTAEADTKAELAPPDDDYDPELALNLDNLWQDQMAQSVDRLETKAEAFIESSSSLYDLLINVQDEKATTWRKPVDEALQAAVARYNELVAEIDTFKQSVARPEVARVLERSPQGAAQLKRVNEVLARFTPASGTATTYAAVSGRLLSSGLFPDKGEAREKIGSVPKTQADALALLDYLRRVTYDLGYLTGTATSWVANTGHKGPGLSTEELTH